MAARIKKKLNSKRPSRSGSGDIEEASSAENKIAQGPDDTLEGALASPRSGSSSSSSLRRPGDFFQGLLGRRRAATTAMGGVSERSAEEDAAAPADRSHRRLRRHYDSSRAGFSAFTPRSPKPPPAASSVGPVTAAGSTIAGASPRSPPDPNKPLPSPPPNPGLLQALRFQPPPPPLPPPSSLLPSSPSQAIADASPAGFKPKPSPVLKLDRIMATLSDAEIEKLFSGAPQYFARSEGHCTGAPNPSVAFPFDEELEIRDLTDHVQIEDRAWSAVTAWPHLTRDLNRDADAKKKVEESSKAHFFLRCRERPNMLSMSGLEKGTMGYSAALELSVGDSLEEEQFGFESVGKKNQVIVEARERMLSSLGGLRRLPETEILDRLKRNGELYRDNDLRKKTSVQTYQDLFHTFMRPVNSVVDKRDHYSLTNQINALLKCLGASNVWFDFTHVEWRIRLGQILWGEEDGDDLEDLSSIHDANTTAERAEEKYWLLMQILVATELLIRLDAVTEGEEYGVEAFRPIDVVHFERAATKPVKWSLHLARSWLENIDLAKIEGTPPRQPSPPPAPTGWLSSLVSKITLRHRHEEEASPSSYTYTIKGRHGPRQVEGLIHFAKKLQWPGIEDYEARIALNARNSVGPGASSGKTPKTSKHMKRSSYFGQWDVSSGNPYDRGQSHRRKLAAALHKSGWLSKSYVFGLMLPGDGLYHYLMATLLENDSEAMAKLGPFANLCGGFVYGNKSFWSTSCIVGRVIAAGKGSAECMGWVSSDILPTGLKDGWINVEVEDVAEDMAHLGKKARLWAKKRIEKESSILGDADDMSVLPADFIIPHENNYSTPPPRVDIDLRSLELLSPANMIEKTPFKAEADANSIPKGDSKETPKETNEAPQGYSSDVKRHPDLYSYPANAHFDVSIDGGSPVEFSFRLAYDISFVTAHPCAPSQRVRFLKSPTSPTIQQIDVDGIDPFSKSYRSAHRAGHPLHKYYNYTVIHLSELLKRQHAPLDELINSAGPNNPGYTNPQKGTDNRVLVIDCITNYAEVPGSPTLERLTSKYNIVQRRGSFPAAAQMHFESRKRQFGSDMEILVRALCAQNGWNAIISRRKRGCLACAIREAGALQWKVIVRVE